jgi:hypothetical protein
MNEFAAIRQNEQTGEYGIPEHFIEATIGYPDR